MGTCESDIYDENKQDSDEEYIQTDFMKYVVLANWKPDENDGSNSINQLNFNIQNIDKQSKQQQRSIQQSRITQISNVQNNNSPYLYDVKPFNQSEQKFGVSTLAFSRYTEINKQDVLEQNGNLQQSQMKQVQF